MCPAAMNTFYFHYPNSVQTERFFSPRNATNSKTRNLRNWELCRAYAGPENPALAGSLFFTASDGQSFYTLSGLLRTRDSLPEPLSKSVTHSANLLMMQIVREHNIRHSRSVDRALSDFDSRHQLSFNYFYTLPSDTAGAG